MFERDFMMRMIKQMAHVLKQILNYKKRGQWENAQMVIDVASKQLLNLNIEVIERLEADALIEMFTYNGETEVEKCLTLATLLVEQAEIFENTGQADLKIFELYLKSFQLFNTASNDLQLLKGNYLNYAVHCCDKLSEYKIETDLMLQIVKFYKQYNFFAKAENVLYQLLDQNEKDAKEYAINFYKHLLKCDDQTLIKGDLPRDEVIEGLIKLTGQQDPYLKKEINVRFLTPFLLLAFQITLLFGQPGINYSSAEIQAALNKLNVLGSVLYIAAHPDDENQGFLTYMSKRNNYRTAYLSLTRGGGGQNLLGAEKGALLGVVRTQELLAARKFDGAQQFFTRAIDFGYSKTAEETLSKWDHKTILGDVVKIIRQFRPDIIVTRFTKTRGGHGHHISSAILAREAFHAAADPKQYPGQLNKLKPWQTKRMFWNSWLPNENRPATASPILSLNLGEYSPLYGFSYREIAAKSRSMHKTQGFGATPTRGNSLDHFELTAGDTSFNDLMEGVETSWKRIDQNGRIQLQVSSLNKNFDPQNPQTLVPELINLYTSLEKKENSFWIGIKKDEVKKLLQMCSGLWLEAIAFDESVTPGSSVKIKITVLNRSAFPIKFNKVKLSYHSQDTVLNLALNENTPKSLISTVNVPKNAVLSQPYWLTDKPGETMFNVTGDFSGQAEGKPALEATIGLVFDKTKMDFTIPVEYRWNDPKEGEQHKPLVILPDVGISFSAKVFVFKDTAFREIKIIVRAMKDNVSGTLKTILPKGWKIKPAEYRFNLEAKDEQATFTFKIKPGKDAQNGTVRLFAETGHSKLNNEVVKIDYPHIPTQIVLQPAEAKLIKLEVIIPEKKVAYIMGSGDEIPQALQQIGISVDLISDEGLINVDYSKYDAVICGIRAFNTREDLGLYQKRILKYVENGGTWIVQHNTRFGKQVVQIGPYPFVAQGRDRISEEDAEMEMLIPSHALFNYPNKITDNDFEGWVQERGTYLAESWQGKLYPLLAGHDKGEPSKLGSLLYAPYGKGVFIFTAISWFRQLPAGVPGAYRLFVNLISAKQ